MKWPDGIDLGIGLAQARCIKRDTWHLRNQQSLIYLTFTASGQGHLEVIQWLIENGANASITNNAGENAKDVARRFAQLPAIRILGGDEGAST